MTATRTRRPSAYPNERRRAASRTAALAVAVVLAAVAAPMSAAPAKKPAKSTKAAAAPTAKARTNRSAAPAGPAPTTTSGDPLKDQAEQSAERDRLTQRIADLKRQIAAGEKSRSGASAALARAERALADVNRRLDEIAQRQRATLELVATLDRQRSGTARQIATGEAALGRTVNKLSTNQARDPVRTFLTGGDPNEPLRTAVYLRYLAQAETADLDALQARATDLQSRRQRADDDSRALAEQADAQKAARESLANDQASQRQALAQLSQKLSEQRNAASALEADERRLTQVVQQLQRVIERRAAEERARREAALRQRAAQEAAAAAAAAKKSRDEARQAAREGREAPVRPPPREAPPIRVDAVPDESPGSGAFARLRGQLRLPVRGTVTGRFGGARGSGGATWKGVFVRTEPGAEVRAVAAGHVIFADDLRGFGNLLIVDHGGQYLSIYGNNDALLRKTGDAVAAGDVIARTGSSIGDDQTGLYFELRFQGRPFDPLSWVGGR